jgi:hypothetical protein
MIGVVLNNKKAPPGQTLYFHILFFQEIPQASLSGPQNFF